MQRTWHGYFKRILLALLAVVAVGVPICIIILALYLPSLPERLLEGGIVGILFYCFFLRHRDLPSLRWSISNIRKVEAAKAIAIMLAGLIVIIILDFSLLDGRLALLRQIAHAVGMLLGVVIAISVRYYFQQRWKGSSGNNAIGPNAGGKMTK